MVLQEFVYLKEKSDKAAKDLSRLNEIKKNVEVKENTSDDEYGRSHSRKYSE